MRVPWTARRSNESILREISPEYSLKGLMASSNMLVAWCKEPTHWKRPWCWERLKAGGDGDDTGWDGWMESPTWWTWVWTSSRSWWWTGKPGLVLNWTEDRVSPYVIVESSVQFSCWVMSDSLQPHESQHARPPCPSPTQESSPVPQFKNIKVILLQV